MRLAEKLAGDQRRQLIASLNGARAESVNEDGSLVLFHLESYARPAYEGQHAFPVEGTMLDAGRSEVSVALYAEENNRIYELEFIRWAEGDLISPDWSSLQVS